MTPSDQTATLRRLASGGVVSLSVARTRVVAVTGGKGGVGKSTIAVNLAATWARQGARTLALDADLGMADLNLLLGLAPAHSLLDLLRGCPIDEVLVPAHGFHLLPALNGSFQLANLDARSREALFASLEELAQRFDTLVVDTPAGIGENAMAFAGAAADVVVVATAEPLSLADAYACLKVLAKRHGLERAFVLPNAVRTPSEADEVVERLTALTDRFLGITLLALPAVPFDAAVPAAAAEGQPLVLHKPDAPASRAIQRTARRLDALAEGDPRRAGLWIKDAVGAARHPGPAATEPPIPIRPTGGRDGGRR